MPGIATEFLFTIALDVPVLALGDTPYGGRRIARFAAGSFEGPKLRGAVLPGGGWMILRRDGVLDIEVRIIAFARSRPARVPGIGVAFRFTRSCRETRASR
jgi:hypothetical protein